MVANCKSARLAAPLPLLAIALFAASPIHAQPAAPSTSDLPCQGNAGTEEVAIPLDSGFISIFNGTDFKGWWNNCKTEDAQANRSQGGIFRVDPVEKAIYSTQRSGGGGSMLVTNRKWSNHEIILDLWPDWGNDAGLFHRTTAEGKAYQTVLDYKPKNCIGGSYPQQMETVTPQLFYNCAYFFNDGENQAIQGGTGNAGINRSSFTWSNMWDTDGWNQLRVKVFGNPPRHQSWMRKSSAQPWTQVLDVTWPSIYSNAVAPTGHIGFQIHYGGDYWTANSKGNWYRNIKIRDLDNNGNPISTSLGSPSLPLLGTGFTLVAGRLKGRLMSLAQVTVRDIKGKLVVTRQASAGHLELDIPDANGLLFVELRSNGQAQTHRVARL